MKIDSLHGGPQMMHNDTKTRFLPGIARLTLPLVLVASVLIVGIAGPVSAAAANGTGTLTTKTTSVSAGSTAHTITFTYTAATGGISDAGVHVTVPAGWSPPSTTGTAAGYTTSSAGTVTVDGQTIIVLGETLAAGATLTINYGARGAKGPGATATSSVGPQAWTAYEKSTSGGTETLLAKSPSITVTTTLPTPAAPNVALVSPSSIAVTFTPYVDAKTSTVTVRLTRDNSVVKAITGNTSGTEVVTGLTPGDTYYATITSVGNDTDYFTSSAGAHSGNITPGVLTVSAHNTYVNVGQSFDVALTVSGLTAADKAVVTKATFTYTGVGATVYAASTVAPSAVGTYTVVPANATVVVTPSADQSIYAATFNYAAASLVISAPTKALLHASRVAGGVWTGRSVLVSIYGTGFSGQPRIISSTGRSTTARVTHDTGKRLIVRVTVKVGTPPGVHVFKITLADGNSCNVHYSQF
jgi:hypothetical protein